MTDPAIIAASYAAEHNYSHNPDDVIDASNAVCAIGTEKVDTTTLKDGSPENNDATINGAMPTEGFIQGRRYDGVDDYLDCGNDISLATGNIFSISTLINRKAATDRIIMGKATYQTNGWIMWNDWFGADDEWCMEFHRAGYDEHISSNYILPANQTLLLTVVVNNNNKNIKFYVNGILKRNVTYTHTFIGETNNNLLIGGYYGPTYSFNGSIIFTNIYNFTKSAENEKQFFNILACLPFWSVNYTDYPNNITTYTDNLPYSSSIISSGTFKVDDDKLQCVSAGTITYTASYEFNGSEYIKVGIDGVEYAGTGTITQGNTTVSVAQDSNKITIQMGTGNVIGEVHIQFKKEV